uniref:Uncharacterized protein n=1 Tax=Lepeophtheirus salmonis TaxID=72036 RepID=A0A0K2UYC0_LEPSM
MTGVVVFLRYTASNHLSKYLMPSTGLNGPNKFM